MLLPDGQIELDGQTFLRPSAAGVYLRKRPTNGWSFFLVDPKTRRSLRHIRSEYIESLDVDLDDDEEDDDDDE